MKAKDIMTTPVVTATPATPVKRIVEMLVEHDVSALPIVDETGELLGIVGESDVVRLQSIEDPRLHAVPFGGRDGVLPRVAADVMTINVVSAAQDDDVTLVARRMLALHLKRLPVLDGKKVVGIISRRDILKVLARSDASIEAELQERLDGEIVLLGWFHAAVDDGVATLRGPRDKDGRRLATLIARSIPGVVAVRFDDDP